MQSYDCHSSTLQEIIINSLILANMALISTLLDKYSGQDNGNFFGTIYLFVGSFMATVPMVVMIGFVCYKFTKKVIKWLSSSSNHKVCCLKLKKKPDIETNQQEDNSESKDDFELPDHILHPEEYGEETSMKPTGMDSTKNSRNLSSSNHA
jgi:hypothetical protein